MREGVRRVIDLATACVFPVFCVMCDHEGSWLCGACEKQLPTGGVFCCPACHAERPLGQTCDACREKTVLTHHAAAFPYDEHGAVGQLLHAYKYQYAEDVEVSLRRLVMQFVVQHPAVFADSDCLVSVPLHARRFAERGFNQAERLARMVADACGLPLRTDLKRTRATPHQAQLSRADRLTNVAGAFDLAEPVAGKRIMIVDDVFTTGSTIGECAKALYEKGAVSVRAFTLARG